MTRDQQIDRAEMYRCGKLTTAFRGGEKQHESISIAKRYVRSSGLSCVAEVKGENLRHRMDVRIAAEEERQRIEAERLAAEAKAKAEAEAAELAKAA